MQKEISKPIMIGGVAAAVLVIGGLGFAITRDPGPKTWSSKVDHTKMKPAPALAEPPQWVKDKLSHPTP